MNERKVLWKAFTANRDFNKDPKIFVKSDGMYYTKEDGKEVLDGLAGLWCCNLGNNHRKVVDAIVNQAQQMYFCPPFQLGNDLELELANEIKSLAPKGLNHIFFTNSGSESVESALKMALAYQKSRGKGNKNIIIGREHSYHGVNFGGISVGGLVNNKRDYNNQIKTTHIPTILDIEKNAFSKGIPKHGKEKAEFLLHQINLHGAENIAAVIMEPIAGAAGVHIPPKGYLKRVEKICKQNDILLIFDEVITGFGRLGTAFAAQKFGIKPDIITTAKGLTSGSVPMGAVIASKKIYKQIVKNSKTPIEFFHGYTYSGHPLACAAALATIKAYKEESLFERVASLEEFFQEQIHSLKKCKNVIDIRNLGLVGAIQLKSDKKSIGKRGKEVFEKCYKKGVLVRPIADTIALSPAFIISKKQITEIIEVLREVINKVE
ncbi:aspartate aminotransferase family protein [Arcobacter sp. F155]|uniref:aminotransferase class III-fold pyridoxal phosphate-dependent enzyme n=1 Tax=Arcobacter sp. F155 TaxID=2044512 RepID=UPI00100A4E98|nr:aminotransferase class III-fold pyridoxal phosphate-dependent enzyme [Arcobacter sp. F155]RXJ77903.1 aspartate aminotransferase family protein [Arcobacter sp. F155]